MFGLVIAFKDYQPFIGVMGSKWVGFKHFERFFSSEFCGRVIKNTFGINILNLLLSFPAPIILALLLNEVRHPRFKKSVQTITYMPHFISLVVIVGIMQDILSVDYGIINRIILFFGGEQIRFMTEPGWFKILYVLSGIWQNVGWSSIIYIAAIDGIDQELYDAAMVDGANRWHKIRYITLPGISDTIIILLIMQIGNMLNVAGGRQMRKSKFTVADIIIYLFLLFMIVVTLYPVIYIFSTSVSSTVSVMKNEVIFLPKGFSLGAYRQVFKNDSIWTGYRNSIFLLIVGTAINVIMNILAAYPLSRRGFCFRRSFMLMILFTMFFSGGMIPTYLVVDGLNLTDTLWGLIIPTAVSAYNVIIMRSFFENIPESLEEAVKIDGGNDLDILLKIFIPLSKPVIAVIALYYGVGHWNGFTQALIYIRDRVKFPLQVILRELLLQDKVRDMVEVSDVGDMLGATRSIQYATIVVSIVPMLIVYPFLQKYFVKGVMIGAVKG